MWKNTLCHYSTLCHTEAWWKCIPSAATTLKWLQCISLKILINTSGSFNTWLIMFAQHKTEWPMLAQHKTEWLMFAQHKTEWPMFAQHKTEWPMFAQPIFTMVPAEVLFWCPFFSSYGVSFPSTLESTSITWPWQRLFYQQRIIQSCQWKCTTHCSFVDIVVSNTKYASSRILDRMMATDHFLWWFPCSPDGSVTEESSGTVQSIGYKRP